MCLEDNAADGYSAVTRNGSKVVIQSVPGSAQKLLATVVKSTDPKKHPVGKQVVYQSGMGHVRCTGTGDEDGCRLHALDAVRVGQYLGTSRVAREVKEATGKKPENEPKEFKVGDTVIVRRPKLARDRNGDPWWMKEMDIYDGVEAKIGRILNGGSFKLTGHRGIEQYAFNPKWIEATVLKDSDLVPA